MALAVDAAQVAKTIEAAKEAGVKAYTIGETVEGDKGVTLC